MMHGEIYNTSNFSNVDIGAAVFPAIVGQIARSDRPGPLSGFLKNSSGPRRPLGTHTAKYDMIGWHRVPAVQPNGGERSELSAVA
jgi:hypothetical protein